VGRVTKGKPSEAEKSGLGNRSGHGRAPLPVGRDSLLRRAKKEVSKGFCKKRENRGHLRVPKGKIVLGQRGKEKGAPWRAVKFRDSNETRSS